jgi:cyanophycin synthetase
MPLEIRDLRALEGPNIYYLQPAVKLQIWADRDISRAINDSVKTWAQQVGTVIGKLRQDVQPVDNGFLITTTWTTPLPTVGEHVAEGAAADLVAAEQRDEEYSHDEALFAAIDARKREEPSLQQLQLYAEAQVRDLPMLPRGDGTVMIGTGARGWVLDPAAMSLGLGVEVRWDQIGRIPVVAVTGTNGKTTTVRLITHVLRETGLRVGNTNTDGVFINGQQVEEGDWAGWAGTRRVLTDSAVDVAVLETSRGGILRRGLGFNYCDISVITNISADHLGEFEIDTPEQMARVKGTIIRVTRPDGYTILNADDPLVLELGELSNSQVVLFSIDPQNAVMAAHQQIGGGFVRSDGEQVAVHINDQQGQFPLADIPITVGGAALHNVQNVLAATAACLGLGVPLPTIVDALRSFLPSPTHNANRLNLFERDSMLVAFDYAHNEAGLTALVRFGEQMRQRRGGRLLLVLGGPGDRLDQQIHEQGRIAGATADMLLLHEEERYLRGRELGETTKIYQEGALVGGLSADQITIYPDEIAALEAALLLLQPNDVLLIAAHAQRATMLERLQAWERGEPSDPA